MSSLCPVRRETTSPQLHCAALRLHRACLARDRPQKSSASVEKHEMKTNDVLVIIDYSSTIMNLSWISTTIDRCCHDCSIFNTQLLTTMTVDQMKQQSSEICFNIILFGIQKRIGLSTKCLESSCQSQGFLGISGSLQSGFKMSMHLKLSTIKPAPIPYHLILVCKGVNKRSRFITPSINRSIRASRPLLPAQPLSQNLMCTFDRCCLIPRIPRLLKPLGLSENAMVWESQNPIQLVDHHPITTDGHWGQDVKRWHDYIAAHKTSENFWPALPTQNPTSFGIGKSCISWAVGHKSPDRSKSTAWSMAGLTLVAACCPTDNRRPLRGRGATDLIQENWRSLNRTVLAFPNTSSFASSKQFEAFERTDQPPTSLKISRASRPICKDSWRNPKLAGHKTTDLVAVAASATGASRLRVPRRSCHNCWSTSLLSKGSGQKCLCQALPRW